jgi:cytochrome P450
MLCTDGRRHRDMRHVFTRPLVPAAVATLRERLRGLAEARLDELVARGRFDGVADLAHYLPLTVVTELVGFNEEGRRQMLRWAAAMFDSMGPEGNTRTLEGLAITGEMFEYIATRAPRSSLDPAGWGAALFAAADRGELAHADAQSMLIDYLGPALDTTIHGTSAALWLFARHPEQWQALRAEPALIPGAINEVLRLESPIRAFTRHATRDVVVDGTLIPAGARVLMLYACANRDGRRYADPEAFDIRRNAADHLAFGQGAHACAGMHLARLEIGLLLEGLARRVAGFELHAAQRAVHNTLRGFASLDLSVRAA